MVFEFFLKFDVMANPFKKKVRVNVQSIRNGRQ
jgi:hypothetical protein